MHSSAAASIIVAVLSVASLATAQSRTDWVSEAAVTDPDIECTKYSYAPATAVQSHFPTLWTTANLSFAGATAYDKALFTAMNSSIPKIAPKGTRDGNFTTVSYNGTDTDCWWSWAKCTTPKIKTLPTDVTKCEEPNTFGLTLDDGPNCSHNAYYDYLNQIGMKASLFYVGSNVLVWPLEAQRGLAEGHEVCSHTWSHPYMTALTNEQAFAELYYTKKIIKELTGVTVRCWRPPYGDVDDRIRYIANALDMATIGWSDDVFDWRHSVIGVDAVKANYQSILDKQANGTFATTGTITLMHELDNTTMSLGEAYLPAIIEKFSGGVLPVAVCRNDTQPYVETAYSYPNFVQWAAGTRTIAVPSPTAVGTDVRLNFTGHAPTITATGPASASGTIATSSVPTANPDRTTLASNAGSSKTATATSGVDKDAAPAVLGVGMSGVVAAVLALLA
ncbi:chitin deacetylase-like manno protein MP98 [Meredithblackwellia eburnea MCA 4105]